MKHLRKIIQCGKKCWIREDPAPAYGKNKHRPASKNPTTEQQMKLNDKYAAENIKRLIWGNFTPHKDLFVTLEHFPWVSEEKARKARKKFLGLMRDWYKNQDKEFRYIIVTEKQGCWHHHLVMGNVPLELLRKFWGKATQSMCHEGEENRIVLSTLNPFDDFKSLSEYLVNPEKPSRKENPTPEEAENAKKPRKKGERRYSCSKNLEKPVITPQVINQVSKSEPKPPKGYMLQTWNKWCDSWGEMHAEYTCIWTGAGRPPKARKRDYTKKRKRE